MDNVFWIAVFVVGAIFAWIAYLSAKREEQRRQALSELAAQIGLHFSREDCLGVCGTFAQFELFQEGDTRHAYNLLHGSVEGRNYCCCDLEYTTIEYTTNSKGEMVRQEVTTYCSVALAELNFPVPAVWLRPENFLDKAAHLVGVHDLQFESNEFNQAFHVKASDREIAFDILTPQTMQALLDAPFRHIEFNGAAVMIFDKQTWSPEQFAAAIDTVKRLAEGLPRYLFDKLRERAQS